MFFPEVFCKKSTLKNYAKFTGKAFRPATLLKRDSNNTGVFLGISFSWEFKFLDIQISWRHQMPKHETRNTYY